LNIMRTSALATRSAALGLAATLAACAIDIAGAPSSASKLKPWKNDSTNATEISAANSRRQRRGAAWR